MKILVLGDLGSYHTHLFSKTLASLGHDVLVASLEEPIENADGYSVIRIKSPFRRKKFYRYLSVVPKFISLERSYKPDLVFAHFISNYGLIGKFMGSRKILVIWGSDVLVVPGRSIFHKKGTKGILKEYKVALVDAGFVAGILREEFRYEGRIFTFPFGPSPDFLKINVAKKKKGLLFVTHRRLDPDMDPFTIIRAFEMIRKKNVKLYVLSDGSLKNAIVNYVNKRKLDGFIHLTGRVSRKELIRILLNSSFFISAAITDSTSVSLLEAMATGCLPIVSDIPGNREWVNSDNGLIFETGNYEDLAQKINAALEISEAAYDSIIKINKTIVENRANFYRNLQELIRKANEM